MDCDTSMIAEGVERCPFLRNIGEPTMFNFGNFPPIKFPVARQSRGPIFEDGPGFDNAFRLFHGKDGVIPLAQKSEDSHVNEAPKMSFNPLAASAATISLSAFGPLGGAFNFDAFMAKKQKKKPSSNFEKSAKGNTTSNNGSSNHSTANHATNHLHEALSSDWLATGKCPIAKSCRAVSGVLPLVAKWFKPPPGTKVRCPPAIVAARAALASTAFAKNLRPQPLSNKLLAIGLLGMATNVPLGVWREHTRKFSPAWFIAVHAAVPFIAMMRKAVLMPKHAMAFTIAASILGQVIGSRAERLRLAQARLEINPVQVHEQIVQASDPKAGSSVKLGSSGAATKLGSSTMGTGKIKQQEDEFFDATSDVADDSSSTAFSSVLSQKCAMLAWGEENSQLQKSSSSPRSVTVF